MSHIGVELTSTLFTCLVNNLTEYVRTSDSNMPINQSSYVTTGYSISTTTLKIDLLLSMKYHANRH